MKFLKSRLAAALALTVFACGVAFALNPPANYVFPARQNATQQTNYYRVLVNYNDPWVASPGYATFGTLPLKAFVTNITCEVVTAFNASTTNVLTLGTTTTATNLVDAATSNMSITEGTAGVYAMTASTGLGRGLTASAAVPLYVKYTYTGDAPTAGVAVCVIEYVPDNDQ